VAEQPPALAAAATFTFAFAFTFALALPFTFTLAFALPFAGIAGGLGGTGRQQATDDSEEGGMKNAHGAVWRPRPLAAKAFRDDLL